MTMPVSERAFDFAPLADEELTYGQRIHDNYSPEGRVCRELLALRAAVRRLVKADIACDLSRGADEGITTTRAWDAALNELHALLAHIDGAQEGES